MDGEGGWRRRVVGRDIAVRVSWHLTMAGIVYASRVVIAMADALGTAPMVAVAVEVIIR